MVNILELRKRAKRFAESWKDAYYEKGQTQTFYYEFFQMFDKRIVDWGRFEVFAKRENKKYGFIDMFWKKVLLIEQKSEGEDMDEAYTQATEYFDKLPDHEKPGHILVCDFQTWELNDLQTGTIHSFKLSELPENIHLFNFIDQDTYMPSPADPVSIKASAKMAALYDSLKGGGYDKKDMEYLLTRLTFCMFADYVGIFEENAFKKFLKKDMEPGAPYLGGNLAQLFEVLDKPQDNRQTSLGDDLKAFPYIDGGLFNKSITIPAFSAASRQLLWDAAEEDWSKVSPAIFGALFQNVMDVVERRSTGSHYTPEENIMKVIQPLFLDSLETEFEAILKKSNSKAALKKFHEKLSTLTFFDPACGAGNFLIIAYREVRRLETRILSKLYGDQKTFRTHELSKIDVDQFFGIEKNKFSANIAQTSMWMMDHLMNLELGDAFDDTFTRIPIKKAPNIVCADALEMDWKTLLDPDDCSYVFGNPPFSGAANMNHIQKEQTIRICNTKKLDYVCNWFVKALEYSSDYDIKIAFVATNSITQGEQVGLLWPIFQKHGAEISFAYRTFTWESDTQGVAHVHVIIMGLDKKGKTKTNLLYYDSEAVAVKHISPYIYGLNSEPPIVYASSRPLNGLQSIKRGTDPTDDQNYVLTDAEKSHLIRIAPQLEKIIHKYVGADDYINNKSRWLLCLNESSPSEWRKIPEVMKRVNAVKQFRLSRTSQKTIKMADEPTSFMRTTIPTAPYLMIPRHSSNRRKYVPIGYVEPPIVPSDATQIIEHASLGLFGLLTSNMHMVWLKRIGGKLKSDPRYSAGIVYNTFPVPNESLDKLERHAQAVLDARAKHPNSSLADLYDPNSMPPNLHRAHRNLDRKVDKMYRKNGFNGDDERLEFILEKYAEMARQKSQ